MYQAAGGLIGGEPWNWADMALYVLCWSVLGPAAVWLGLRMAARFGLPQYPSARVRGAQSEVIAPAMRSGDLPADAEPDVWQRALRGEVREWNGQRWLAAVTAGLGAVAIGAAAVVANDNAWGVWLVAVVVAACASPRLRARGRTARSAGLSPGRVTAGPAGRPGCSLGRRRRAGLRGVPILVPGIALSSRRRGAIGSALDL